MRYSSRELLHTNGVSMQTVDQARAGKTPSNRVMPQDVRKAIAFMRRNLSQQVAMPQLAVIAGTSGRSLRSHFSEFVGMSPAAYWRRLRLSAARDSLLSPTGDPITEVAAQYGFDHFGRFASDYRRCFRELPSETRRRAERNAAASHPEASDELPSGRIAAPCLAGIKPTLIILPFQNAGDCVSRDLASALVEKIAAELAKLQSFSIRLADSALVPDRWATVRRKIASQYCLTGRISQTHGRLRVIVRLIDGERTRVLWGDSFDGDAREPFHLHDQVSAGVLTAIRPSILTDEIELARQRDPSVLGARELALRALPLALSWNRTAAALDPLYQAIELDRGSALPTALAGWCHARLAAPWHPQYHEERAKADRLGDLAGVLDAGDPLVLAIRAGIAQLVKEFDDADTLTARALAKDPTCAWAWDRRGWLREATNRHEDAMPIFARIEQIAVPYLDGAESLVGIGTAHFSARSYDKAAHYLRQAAVVRGSSTDIHAKLAASYVQLGELAAGQTAFGVMRRALPDVTARQFVESYPCNFSSFRDVLASSLVDLGMRP